MLNQIPNAKLRHAGFIFTDLNREHDSLKTEIHYESFRGMSYKKKMSFIPFHNSKKFGNIAID